jgi:ABC-type enterochelin transport system permease subunit
MQTALRAVSVRGVLTPLAVLVPILATVAAATWALTVFPPLILVAVAGGLTATAFAGKRPYGIGTSLVTGGVTLVAGAVGLFIVLVVSFSSSICGKTIADAWVWVPLTGGALVYFALGIYGFLTDRAPYVVPMALLFGVLMMLLLIYLVPGSPGFCD